jgi:hypothetical protein
MFEVALTSDVTVYGLRTRLVFGSGQIEIFIGELHYMLPDNSQVRHLIPFPGMEMHQNILNKMN